MADTGTLTTLADVTAAALCLIVRTGLEFIVVDRSGCDWWCRRGTVISAFRTAGTREYSVISVPGTLGTREYSAISAFGTPDTCECSANISFWYSRCSRVLTHFSFWHSRDRVIQNDWYSRVID